MSADAGETDDTKRNAHDVRRVHRLSVVGLALLAGFLSVALGEFWLGVAIASVAFLLALWAISS